MDWKFSIGETVEHISGFRCFIRERITQECSGGTQQFYRCLVFGASGRGTVLEKSFIEFTEAELRALPQEPTSLMESLQMAKEFAVSEVNFDLAAMLRDAADKLKNK